MKYSASHDHQEPRVRRSANVVLSPYFIDDVAITPESSTWRGGRQLMVIAGNGGIRG
jgi:hypothetical protein